MLYQLQLVSLSFVQVHPVKGFYVSKIIPGSFNEGLGVEFAVMMKLLGEKEVSPIVVLLGVERRAM